MQFHQLYAKMSKYVFGSTLVEYLRHVISGKEVSTDPFKIKAMQEWHVPVNIKKLIGLVIVCDATLRAELLKYYPNEPIGGHSSMVATYKGLKAMFNWKEMRKSVKEHVRICIVCQCHKPDFALYSGLLQPLPIPTKIWIDTSLKFFKGLPSSHGKTIILVVVDKLSKYAHFNLYLTLLRLYKGLSEKPKEWVNWLALPEFWYNTNHHTTINAPLFEVVYGQKSDTHVSYMAGDSHIEVVDRSLFVREADISLLRFHFERAQHIMKEFADKHRSDMVVANYGVMAYKLLLPENATVYNVFHVSQLKPFKGQPAKRIPLLHCTTTSLFTAVPVAMLDRKIAKVRNATIVYWLVQWSSEDVEYAWELATEIQAKYPKFNVDS
ncbi:retrotransposon-related protein [Tanacetum coccineum]